MKDIQEDKPKDLYATTEINNIEIEDPYSFFTPQEREEFLREQAKKESVKEEPKEKAKKKKKKNNKRKNKKNGKIFEIPQTNPYRELFDIKEFTKSRFQDNSIFRLINNWEEKEWFQTNPPTKDIDEQFPTQIFPQGEIQPYLK